MGGDVPSTPATVVRRTSSRLAAKREADSSASQPPPPPTPSSSRKVPSSAKTVASKTPRRRKESSTSAITSLLSTTYESTATIYESCVEEQSEDDVKTPPKKSPVKKGDSPKKSDEQPVAPTAIQTRSSVRKAPEPRKQQETPTKSKSPEKAKSPARTKSPDKLKSSEKARSPVRTKSPEKAKMPARTKSPEKAKTPVTTKSPDKPKSSEKSKSLVRTKSPEKPRTPVTTKSLDKPKSSEKAKSPARTKSPEKAKTPVTTKLPDKPKSSEKTKSPARTKSPEKPKTPVTTKSPDKPKSSEQSSKKSATKGKSGKKSVGSAILTSPQASEPEQPTLASPKQLPIDPIVAESVSVKTPQKDVPVKSPRKDASAKSPQKDASMKTPQKDATQQENAPVKTPQKDASVKTPRKDATQPKPTRKSRHPPEEPSTSGVSLPSAPATVDANLAVLPNVPHDLKQFYTSSAAIARQMKDARRFLYADVTKLNAPKVNGLELMPLDHHDEAAWWQISELDKKWRKEFRKLRGDLADGEWYYGDKEEVEEVKQIADIEEEDDEELEEEDLDDEDEFVDEEEEGEEEEEEGANLFDLDDAALETLEEDLAREAAEDDDDEDEDEEAQQVERKKTDESKKSEVKKYKRTAVDDRFFSAMEMEHYLDEWERETEHENLLDLDEDEGTARCITSYTYGDLYGDDVGDVDAESSRTKQGGKTDDKKKKKKGDKRQRLENGHQAQDEGELEPEGLTNGTAEDGGILFGKGATADDSAPETRFEREQKKRAEAIQRLEAENLAPRSWELRGEVTADTRREEDGDEHALLKKHLHFDGGVQSAPEITPDHNARIEAIVLQRIKDQIWDDPVRKKKEEQTVEEYRVEPSEAKLLEKTSLAAVYEQEYLEKQQEKDNAGEHPNARAPNPAHKEIERRMAALFDKVDALSHYTFTPRAPKPELTIVSNMAALRREEAGPTAEVIGGADEQLLAPEEVRPSVKAAPTAVEERSDVDKKRERRKKKRKQHDIAEAAKSEGTQVVFKKKTSIEKRRALEKRVRKLEKERARQEKTKLKASNFFVSLQSQIARDVADRAQKQDDRKNKKKRKDKAANEGGEAKRLKL